MRYIFAHINTYLETCFLVFAIALLLIHIHAATLRYPSRDTSQGAMEDAPCNDRMTTQVVWKLSDHAESTYTECLVKQTPVPIPVPSVVPASTITNEELTTLALLELQCTAPLETPFVIVNAKELLVSKPLDETSQTECLLGEETTNGIDACLPDEARRDVLPCETSGVQIPSPTPVRPSTYIQVSPSEPEEKPTPKPPPRSTKSAEGVSYSAVITN